MMRHVTSQNQNKNLNLQNYRFCKILQKLAMNVTSFNIQKGKQNQTDLNKDYVKYLI